MLYLRVVFTIDLYSSKSVWVEDHAGECRLTKRSSHAVDLWIGTVLFIHYVHTLPLFIICWGQRVRL